MSKALALSVYLNHFDETPKNETMPAYATLNFEKTSSRCFTRENDPQNTLLTLLFLPIRHLSPSCTIHAYTMHTPLELGVS